MSKVYRSIKRSVPSDIRTWLRSAKFTAWNASRSASRLVGRAPEKFRVAILYLTAERNRHTRSEPFVNRYRQWLGEDRVSLIRIDNFNPDLEPKLVSQDTWEMGGDNSFWEFSGWKRGVQSLDRLGISAEVLIFINDACLNHNRDEMYYLMRFDWRSLARARQGLVGCFDYSENRHVLLENDVSTFVRSNFYALPASLATQLEWTFLLPPVLERVLPENLSHPFIVPTTDLNENFRLFSEQWITKRWHRAQQPTEQNWPFLRKKLIACFNERLLTAAVRERARPVIDATQVIWG